MQLLNIVIAIAHNAKCIEELEFVFYTVLKLSRAAAELRENMYFVLSRNKRLMKWHKLKNEKSIKEFSY